MIARVWIAAFVACGPGLAPPPTPKPTPARPGVPPPSDEAGIRRALAGEVTNGGLWFADADCQAQFGHAGPVNSDAFDAFARCVATLQLRPTGRAHWMDDASVLTDAAGFEIEALVVDGKLEHIGFAGRGPGMPDLPTITPEALEALRVGGDPNATISEFDAGQLAFPGQRDTAITQHLRLCLNEGGEVTRVMPGGTTSPGAFRAFATRVVDWKFRPFTVAGAAIPVCAIRTLHYPVAKSDVERRLPKPPLISKAGNVVYDATPREMEPLRLTGSKTVVPDDEDKVRVAKSRTLGLVGSFKLCVDETGRYERGVLLKSTGLASYDAKIARALMAWTFKPVVVNGIAIPVCSAVTFIYTQR